MGHFAKSLRLLRREAGFQTPYAFYHRNGGRRVFPFTYGYYLKLEHGRHLPRPGWLPILLNLLRLPPSEELRHRLVTDYLRDHFESPENYDSLVAPLLAPAPAPNHARQTAKRLLSEQVYHLTPEQYKAVVADAATYWAFEILVNDREAFDAERLAGLTGLPKAALEAGLRRLAAQKLAKRASGSRYRSPLAGKFYQFPRAFPGIESWRRKLAKHLDAMSARRGSVLHDSAVVIRAEAAAMRVSASSLRDALEAATSYSVYEKTEDSGIYHLEIRARKTLDF